MPQWPLQYARIPPCPKNLSGVKLKNSKKQKRNLFILAACGSVIQKGHSDDFCALQSAAMIRMARPTGRPGGLNHCSLVGSLKDGLQHGGLKAGELLTQEPSTAVNKVGTTGLFLD